MPIASPSIRSPFANIPLVSPARKSLLAQSNYKELSYEEFQSTPVRYTRSLIQNQLKSSHASLCVSQYCPDQVNLSLQIQELKSQVAEFQRKYQPVEIIFEQISGQHQYFEDKFQRVYYMIQLGNATTDKPRGKGVQQYQFLAFADSVGMQFEQLERQIQLLQEQLGQQTREKLNILKNVPVSSMQMLGGLENVIGILSTRINKCENMGMIQKKQIDGLLTVIEDQNKQIAALRTALEAEVQRNVLETSRLRESAVCNE